MRRTFFSLKQNNKITIPALFFTADAVRIRAGQLSPFFHLPFEMAIFQTMITSQKEASVQKRELKRVETPAISWARTNSAPGFVVIGQNQFAQQECKLKNMNEDGVKLVRRKTGGGAVLIDEGNAMYTIIRNGKTHSQLTKSQFHEILCNGISKTFNVKAYMAGGKLNDVYVDGLKVAGCAYGRDSEIDLYHTCILVSAKLDKLKNYLEDDIEKLRSKRIESNRQQVTNLCIFDSKKTCKDLLDNLEREFEAVCGSSALHTVEENDIAGIHEVQAISKTMQEPSYLLREPGEYNHSLKKRFSWGTVRLFIQINDRSISEISVFTDAVDVSFKEALIGALKGTMPIVTKEVQEVVDWVKHERADLNLSELSHDNSGPRI